jgi:hypothetical protein
MRWSEPPPRLAVAERRRRSDARRVDHAQCREAVRSSLESLDASFINTLAASRLHNGGPWGGLLLQP